MIREVFNKLLFAYSLTIFCVFLSISCSESGNKYANGESERSILTKDSTIRFEPNNTLEVTIYKDSSVNVLNKARFNALYFLL
jgi:hypothetical protein